MTNERSGPELAAELEELRAGLAEAEEVLRAIRNGEVDAVVVAGESGEQVYTLSGADRVYRQLIETMSEGAATLSADGVILYCNVRLAEMLGRPLDQVMGTALRNYLPPADQQALDAILAQARTATNRREINLKTSEGRLVPVYLSASRLQSEGAEMVFCLVLTDLTEQKRHEQIVAAERLARSILEQAAEGIVVCDEEGRVIRASQAAQQFCDGSPLLRPFAEVFPLRTDASDPFHLAPVLQGETLRNVDVTLDRQGQKLDLILNAGPLLSGQQILGCVVTLTDLTERRRGEELLRLQATVLEAAANAIVITDRDGRIAWVNPAFTRLTGYTLSEVWGQNPRLLKSGQQDPSLYRDLWETILAGQVWHGEIINRRKDGSLYTEEQTITPVRDQGGEIGHFIAIKQDVTARKQAEEDIRSLAKFPSENPYPILRLNHDGKVLYANEASEALMQQWGCSVGAPAPPEWREVVRDTLKSRSGRMTDVQCGERIYSLFVAPVPEAGYVNLYGRDITARKRAEEALQRYVARLKNLHATDRAILRAETSEAIAQIALWHIRQLVPCRAASLALFDFAAGSATLLTVRADGQTEVERKKCLTLEAFGMTEALRQGRVDVMEDREKLSRCCRFEPACPLEEVHSCVRVPLVVQGQLIGSLNLGMANPGGLAAEDEEIAREVADQLALAIQQGKLHAAAVRRGEELAALLRATRSVMSGLDLQGILDRIVEQAQQMSGAPHVKVLLLDPPAGVLCVGAARGTAHRPGERLPLDTGLSVTVARTGEVLYSPDPGEISQNPFAAHDRELGIQTYLGIPIKKGAEVLGVLTFNTTTPKEYSPAELAYLTSFADQAAIAIENARLFAETQGHLVKLQAFYEATKLLTSERFLSAVLRQAVEGAARVIGARYGAVGLRDEAGGLKAFIHTGMSPEESARIGSPPVGWGILGLLLQDGRAVRLDDLTKDPRAHGFPPGHPPMQSFLGAPIVTRGKLLGGLYLTEKTSGPFTEADEALLISFSEIVAGLVENATLYEELRMAALQLEARVEDRTRELATANQQLQAISKHKSEFLASMSHELRTPLNSILGFSQVLLEQTTSVLSEKQRRHLGHIHNSGQHLLQLINDILDLSKVEAGKTVLDLQVLRVAPLLEDILVIARGLANKKAQTIETQIAPDLPSIRADPLRFKQILFNLLSNAVKFTPERGTISLRARRVPGIADFKLQIADLKDGDPALPSEIINLQSAIPGDFLEIAVTDTGIGITAEDLPRLFQEFVQLEAGRAQGSEGTGLGLALTKRLVELHGGRIWAASPGEGQGSTFTVVLPFTGPGTREA